jgi:hypothetical protein
MTQITTSGDEVQRLVNALLPALGRPHGGFRSEAFAAAAGMLPGALPLARKGVGVIS